LTDLSTVLSQCTRVADRQTEFSSPDRVCIPCSAVEISDDSSRKRSDEQQTKNADEPKRLFTTAAEK